MQTIKWYASRLKAMSAAEVAWRIGGAVRSTADRHRWRKRWRRPPLKPSARSERADHSWGPVTPPVPLETGRNSRLPAIMEKHRSDVIARADRLCAGELTLFGTYACNLGSINWNFDYSTMRPTPVGYSGDVDYRDHAEVGDAKVVWELSRHQHLLPLARAFRFTGDARYAELILGHIRGWAEQCPCATGMNWRSPLELAIRLINWVWALELIRPAGTPSEPDERLIRELAYRHLWDIARKYSRYSSANNHLIGEAAGVFIGSSFFSELRPAERWRRQSREILGQEILSQTHPDGGHRELAMGYHLFVLEFFLLAGVVARRTGSDFADAYWQRLERMLEFVSAFLEGGDSLPMLGDGDDGYVLELGNPADRARELLAVGAVLFDREDFKAVAGAFRESAFWLGGTDAHERYDRLGRGARAAPLRSRAFPESGYYLLQCGGAGRDDRISVTFDCGELGFGSLAAHGHADALSITLRAFGADVLVDPGTFDYFTYPAWRDHFRGTPAHNTVAIDGRDQSEMLGPFLWGRRATSRRLAWEPGDGRTVAAGEHDGYAGGRSGVTHRRTVTLTNDRGEVLIRDELSGAGEHTADLHFHFAENCRVRPHGDAEYHIDCGRGTLRLALDPALSAEVHRANALNRMGWVSRGYHRKSPSTTLAAKARWRGSLVLSCRISIENPGNPAGAASDDLRLSAPRANVAPGIMELKEACHEPH